MPAAPPIADAQYGVEDDRTDCKAEGLPVCRIIARGGAIRTQSALKYQAHVDEVCDNGIGERRSNKDDRLHSAASSSGGRLCPSRRSTSSAASARLVPGPKIACTPAARSAA